MQKREFKMALQLTVRLTDDLAQEVSSLAKRLRLKRSDIVRMALRKFADELEGEKESHPYEKVKSLLGSVASGIPDLGKNHRKYLLERLKKHA
jgi:Arc/MetJ-type ribon-helix-helix transcriptional regulator